MSYVGVCLQPGWGTVPWKRGVLCWAETNLDEVKDAQVRLLLVDDEDKVQRGVVAVHHLARAPVLHVQLCDPQQTTETAPEKRATERQARVRAKGVGALSSPGRLAERDKLREKLIT